MFGRGLLRSHVQECGRCNPTDAICSKHLLAAVHEFRWCVGLGKPKQQIALLYDTAHEKPAAHAAVTAEPQIR